VGEEGRWAWGKGRSAKARIVKRMRLLKNQQTKRTKRTKRAKEKKVKKWTKE
jgi:hypothetical protein